mmetsp:Transcript_54018/g.130711  ORF Transcript_54018/g.130711 Transcript_54018/m.130711 type:complete len:240 (-) Transcript_54018:703-1422(-)
MELNLDRTPTKACAARFFAEMMLCCSASVLVPTHRAHAANTFESTTASKTRSLSPGATSTFLRWTTLKLLARTTLVILFHLFASFPLPPLLLPGMEPPTEGFLTPPTEPLSFGLTEIADSFRKSWMRVSAFFSLETSWTFLMVTPMQTRMTKMKPHKTKIDRLYLLQLSSSQKRSPAPGHMKPWLSLLRLGKNIMPANVYSRVANSVVISRLSIASLMKGLACEWITMNMASVTTARPP